MGNHGCIALNRPVLPRTGCSPLHPPAYTRSASHIFFIAAPFGLCISASSISMAPSSRPFSRPRRCRRRLACQRHSVALAAPATWRARSCVSLTCTYLPSMFQIHISAQPIPYCSSSCLISDMGPFPLQCPANPPSSSLAHRTKQHMFANA